MMDKSGAALVSVSKMCTQGFHSALCESAGNRPEEHGSRGKCGCAGYGICCSQASHSGGCEPAEGHHSGRTVPPGLLNLTIGLHVTQLYLHASAAFSCDSARTSQSEALNQNIPASQHVADKYRLVERDITVQAWVDCMRTTFHYTMLL